MGHLPRHIPEGGSLVEITCRTVQGRHLLRPSPALSEITVGILARAQARHPVAICGLSFLSNHYHLLLEVDDAQQMAGFMEYLNGNLAKEAGRLADWKGRLWEHRYRPILVSHEEAAQVARLKYVLAQGVKEGLVERPEHWPGLNGATALLTGEPLRGWWFNRSKEYLAHYREKTFTRYQFGTPEALELLPLPCWRDLSLQQIRHRVADLIEQIVEEAAEERRASNTIVLGTAGVRDPTPEELQKRPKKRPAPLVHAATRTVRLQMREAYSLFLAVYREASQRLRNGDRGALFPPGCFPPRLPFVGELAQARPP